MQAKFALSVLVVASVLQPIAPHFERVHPELANIQPMLSMVIGWAAGFAAVAKLAEWDEPARPCPQRISQPRGVCRFHVRGRRAHPRVSAGDAACRMGTLALAEAGRPMDGSSALASHSP